MQRFLPIGSVVLLRDGEKRLMIYGRAQQEVDTGAIWDYVGCLFPEGNLSQEHTYLFNHDHIERVFFLGLQDEEEFVFRETLESVFMQAAADEVVAPTQ